MGFDEDVAAKLVIRRHMTQAADDLQDHRFGRIEVSRSAADVAGIELYLVQALAGFFTGNFDEVQAVMPRTRVLVQSIAVSRIKICKISSRFKGWAMSMKSMMMMPPISRRRNWRAISMAASLLT